MFIRAKNRIVDVAKIGKLSRVAAPAEYIELRNDLILGACLAFISMQNFYFQQKYIEKLLVKAENFLMTWHKV